MNLNLKTNVSKILYEFFSTKSDSVESDSLLFNLFLSCRYWECTYPNLSREFDRSTSIENANFDFLIKQLHLIEGRNLESILHQKNIKIIRLKTFSYPKNTFFRNLGRGINDIDFLVENLDEYNECISLILKNGYSVYPQTRWEAANNRLNLFKNTSYCQTYIDLHNQVSWGLSRPMTWDLTYDAEEKFYRLEDSDLILHLLINWIYQDGFVGIEKLIDIYFLLKNSLSIDLKKINEKAAELKIFHTVDLGLSLMKLLGIPQLESYNPKRKSYQIACRIIDSDFLLNPYQKKFLFIYLKHYVRKNILHAIHYDCLKVLSFFKSPTSEGFNFKRLTRD